MIPKIIHYVWFSDGPLPELQQKCLDSWKRYCPDYEIKRWNADNFDVNCCDFVKEAYAARKWAFVTDYIRLYVLYHEGGIYMDTDVYIRGNLDCFLDNKFFSFIEDNKFSDGREIVRIQAAFMGGEKGHSFLKECLKYYEKMHFDHRYETQSTDLLCPEILAALAGKGYGFQRKNIEQLMLNDGLNIYSNEWCAECMENIRNSNIAVHCCTGSWREYSMWQKIKNELKKIKVLRRIFGKKTTLEKLEELERSRT